jgi:hypothetical protein
MMHSKRKCVSNKIAAKTSKLAALRSRGGDVLQARSTSVMKQVVVHCMLPCLHIILQLSDTFVTRDRKLVRAQQLLTLPEPV